MSYQQQEYANTLTPSDLSSSSYYRDTTAYSNPKHVHALMLEGNFLNNKIFCRKIVDMFFHTGLV